MQVEFPGDFCKPAFKSTATLTVNSKGKQLLRFGGMVDDKKDPLDDLEIIDIGNLLDLHGGS